MPNLRQTTIAGDYVQLTTFDGKSITLPDGGAYTLAILGNLGAPPTNYVTRQGYRQDGVTEVNYTLDKRPVTLQLHRNYACSRALYWSNRAELHDILRPNRNGPMTLTISQSGGLQKRSLVVRADPGAVFAADPQREAGWYIDEQIQLTAFDPVWFDPTIITVPFTGTNQSYLTFPITFPILFSLSGIPLTATVTYTGTWYAYPTITLTGPYTSALIQNLTTGINIIMTVGISAGQKRIITTTPGNLSILDASGVSHFGEVGPGSDLVDFNIRPDPVIANGVQNFGITLFNTALGSSAVMTYQNRYFGI